MRERVRELLEQGLSRQEIARKLGVDPSTVTRHARCLGYPDGSYRPSKFDWAAVQAYYDEGHTIDDCCARFGCSYGAWDKAAVRGDLVIRPRGNGNLGLATRDRVEALLADGLNGAEIGKALGISKSTVAFHRRLPPSPSGQEGGSPLCAAL